MLDTQYTSHNTKHMDIGSKNAIIPSTFDKIQAKESTPPLIMHQRSSFCDLGINVDANKITNPMLSWRSIQSNQHWKRSLTCLPSNQILANYPCSKSVKVMKLPQHFRTMIIVKYYCRKAIVFIRLFCCTMSVTSYITVMIFYSRI